MINNAPSARALRVRLSPALYTLKPLLLAMLAGLPGLANAGSCTATTPGPATCVIPAGVASVNVMAIGGGGGSGRGGRSHGGGGSVVTATLTGVGGTALSLFVGGGGSSGGSAGGGGGGSSNVNAGAFSQVIAGGGGGGGVDAPGGGDGGDGGSGGSGSGGDPYGKSGGRVPSALNPARGGSSGTGGSGGLRNDGEGTSDGNGGGCSGGGGGAGFGLGGLGGLGGGGSGGGLGGGGGGGSNRFGGKSWGGGGGGGSTGGAVSVADNGGVSGGAGGNGSIVITWADPDTAGTPVPVTPPVPPNHTTAVIAQDLNSNIGDSMPVCLASALQTVTGGPVAYQGQRADGSTWFNVGTSPVQMLSLYPVLSDYTPGGNGAVILGGTNQLTLSTRCGAFTTAPALFNRDEFAALASARGLAVSITEQGVITVKSGEGIYVVRPDYWVTPGTPGAPSLVQGADGLYRFTDSGGNSQLLRPAFLSPSALQAGAGPGFGGSFVIQLDGTALFTQSNGTQFVLSPDMVLGPLPPAFAQSKGWADGVNHYRYPMCSYASQGFTRTAK